MVVPSPSPSPNPIPTPAPIPTSPPPRPSRAPATLPPTNVADETTPSPKTIAPSPTKDQQQPSDQNNEDGKAEEGLLNTNGEASSAVRALSTTALVVAVLTTLVMVLLAVVTIGSSASALGPSQGTATAGLVVFLGYLQGLTALGQLQLEQAPEALLDYSSVFSFASFLIPGTADSSDSRRLELVKGNVISGVVRFAKKLHINPDHMFLHSLITFTIAQVALGLILSFFVFRRSSKYSRLVLSLMIVIWSVAIYPLALTASFHWSFVGFSSKTWHAILAIFALAGICMSLVLVLVVLVYPKSTFELAEASFRTLWGSLYANYTYDYRLFFLVKGLVDLTTGIIVGAVTAVPGQLICLMLVLLLYLGLIILCQPYVHPFQRNCVLVIVVLKMVNFALTSAFLASSEYKANDKQVVVWFLVSLNLMIVGLIFLQQLYLSSQFLRMRQVFTFRQSSSFASLSRQSFFPEQASVKANA